VLLEIGAVLLLVLVAIALLVPLIRAARRQRRLHAWPVVTGFVTGHRLRRERDGYCPEHQVRVQLDGRETLAWCGSPDRAPITGTDDITSQPEVAAQRVLDRHQVGRAIRVRVNPRDHAEAYRIEWELPLTLLSVIAGSVFAGFIGASVWILFLS
jgi:hypothetical protein